MTVWASVNEADIGQIKIGQPVRFTVDATRTGRSAAQSPHPVKRDQHAERGRLHRGSNHRQLRREAAPLYDREPSVQVDRRSDALLVPNSSAPLSPAAATDRARRQLGR